jgi:cell division protease FtsH
LQHRSEKLEEIIDEETQEIITACYEDAKQILLKARDKLELMANLLLEKEKIDEKDILDILGPRVWENEAR